MSGSGSSGAFRGVGLKVFVVRFDAAQAVFFVERREVSRKLKAFRSGRFDPLLDGILTAFFRFGVDDAFGEEVHFVPAGQNSNDGGNGSDESDPAHDVERPFVLLIIIIHGGGANVYTADGSGWGSGGLKFHRGARERLGGRGTTGDPRGLLPNHRRGGSGRR